jgi:hypothetical protein
VIGQEREYRHLLGDLPRHLPGAIVAVWKRRDGKLVLVAKRETVDVLAFC